jgi:hypothetical protein
MKSAGSQSNITIDRDSLTEAWGDAILRSLPPLAKALYSAGRFVAVDEGGTQFALPTAAHRDRCAELAPQVEAALARHFGSPVRLVLVVDGGAGEPATAMAPSVGPAVAPTGDVLDDADEFDLENLRAPSTADNDQTSAAEARLLEAFPGASEVLE